MCLLGIFIPEEYLSEGHHGIPRVVHSMKGSGIILIDYFSKAKQNGIGREEPNDKA